MVADEGAAVIGLALYVDALEERFESDLGTAGALDERIEDLLVELGDSQFLLELTDLRRGGLDVERCASI